jgi:putative peptidoglycan lipid II flippase
MAAHAAIVATGILLSRIAGLVRERVFAYYFGGTSMAAGVFRAGLRIPNVLQNLFGEGVLSASFIPVYSRLLAEGEERLAGRVAGAVASLLAAFIGCIVALAIVLTPWIIDLIVPGFEGEARQLTIRVVRILFPATGLLVLSAWCLGILNSHRKFFLSYVAPVIWNAAMITTLVVFGSALGLDSLAVALAWGTVAGSLLQLGMQLPSVFRNARTLRFTLDLKLKPVRTVVRNTGPAVLSRGVVQISAYLDQLIASYLGSGTGAVSILGYAQALYLLPISLFGMSVAAAELPQMSSARGGAEEIGESLRNRLAAGIRQISFYIVPTIVGFLFVGDSIVAALYQTGRFGRVDSVYVWYTLAASTLGLLPVTRARLYNSAFYALQDTKTPLRFAALRVSLSAAFGVILAFPLRPALASLISGVPFLSAPAHQDEAMVIGSAALSASTAIGGWIEYLLLRKALEKRVGKVRVPAPFIRRLWLAALCAGAAALLARSWFDSYTSYPPLEGALILGVLGATYFALTFGLPESPLRLRKKLL